MQNLKLRMCFFLLSGIIGIITITFSNLFHGALGFYWNLIFYGLTVIFIVIGLDAKKKRNKECP